MHGRVASHAPGCWSRPVARHAPGCWCVRQQAELVSCALMCVRQEAERVSRRGIGWMHGRVDAWSEVPLASPAPLVGRVEFGDQANRNRGWQGRSGWQGRFRRSSDLKSRVAGSISEVTRYLGGV